MSRVFCLFLTRPTRAVEFGDDTKYYFMKEGAPQEDDGFMQKFARTTIGKGVLTVAAVTAGQAIYHAGNDMLSSPEDRAAVVQIESHNEQLSQAMEQGMHKFFPGLDLATIRVDKRRVDGGYAYTFADEHGAPIEAISVHGSNIDLRSAFEFDNGAINIGNEQGELLTLEGVSDGLNSIPAHK